MNGSRHVEWALLRSRRVLVLAIALVLLVLAGVVAHTTLQVRQNIREQIAGRDGEVLYAVAMMYYAEDIAEGMDAPITDPGNQLNIVLHSSEIRGVMGVRLLDANGRFVESFPPTVTEESLDEHYLVKLRQLRPVSRFFARAEMPDFFYADEADAMTGTGVPLLEVNVPLHKPGGPLAGIAQFLIEGQSIASEFAQLDRHLARQAGMSFGVGAVLLGATLLAAFLSLRKAHHLVQTRTQDLLRANQELALAARSSALGAVTAHLIHGLKNPLSGLHQYVAARAGAGDGTPEADWEQAVASTRRMQAMISQVVGVLREEQSGQAYEVTLSELEELLRLRLESALRERKVTFASRIEVEATLSNFVANLTLLILVNLAENAIEATPAGKTVTVILGGRNDSGPPAEGWVVFEVRDQGPGFPAEVPLFMPCHSVKEGGSGIGLALCKQLANHLGAELTRSDSTPEGCVFRLRVPYSTSRRRAPAFELAASR